MDDTETLKFTADLSDVRRKIDELAEEPVTVRIQPRDARGRFRNMDYGITPRSDFTAHPGADREDTRIMRRIDELDQGEQRAQQVSVQRVPMMALPGGMGSGYAGPGYSTGYGYSGAGWPGGWQAWGAQAGAGGAGMGGGGGLGGVGGAPPPFINIPNAIPPSTPPAGGGGFGFLRGGLGRFFGIGMAAREVLHALRETQEYGTEMYTAGSDQEAQLTATLKYRQRLTDLPIVGNLVGLLADPGGTGMGAIERIQGDAKQGAVSMQQRERTADYIRSEGYKTAISNAEGGFAKRRAGAVATADEEVHKADLERLAAVGDLSKQRTRALDSLDASETAHRAEIYEQFYGREGRARFGSSSERDEAYDAAIETFNRGFGARRADVFKRYSTDNLEGKFKGVSAGIESRKASSLADIARDETYDQSTMEAKTHAANLRSFGLTDRAEMYLKTQADIAEEDKEEDAGRRGRLTTLHIAEEQTQRIGIGKAGVVRQARDNAIIAQNFSSINRDPYTGAMEGAIAEGVSDIAGAQLTELPRVLTKAASRISRVADDITREVTDQAEDHLARAEAALDIGTGQPFAAEKVMVKSRAEAERRKLPGMDWVNKNYGSGGLMGWVAGKVLDMRMAIDQEEGGSWADIERRQASYVGGLTVQRDVSAALAQGELPGGMRHTAQVRETVGETNLKAQAEGDVPSRMLILETGINRLKALERDLDNVPGGPQQVGAGAVMAGFTSTTDDDAEARKELTEAIKDLTTQLAKTADTEFGGSGDSSGGDF